VTRSDVSAILYRNNHDGTFEDVTTSFFGANHLKNVNTNGVGAADIDNDGDLDLYVTAQNTNRYYLYINQGNSSFQEQGVSRNAVIQNSSTHFGTSPAFGDYDQDGYLDLYVSEWATQPAGVMTNNRLLHNRGSDAPGFFTDVTTASQVVVDDDQGGAVIAYGFSPGFADLDGDGRPDLALGADFHSSKLFWNNGDGTFSNGTAAAGVGKGINDMGSVIADYNGDGKLDWFTTAIVNSEGNHLYRNEGNRVFSDQTDAKGVRDGGWGWGTNFIDFDNDGDLDLINTNGFVGEQFLNDQTRFWRNDNGQYVEVSNQVGITDTGEGRGLLTFDYDNDGDLDIFIVNHAGQPVLYRNDGGNNNNYLRIKTVGTQSNRDGIGAKITIVPDLEADLDPALGVIQGTMFHEVNANSTYLAQSEITAHFGLGNLDQVDLVSIQWPSGDVQNFFNVDANQLFIATEGQATVLVGDMDGNGVLNAFDTDDFELALSDPDQYMLEHPGIDPNIVGDITGDGVLDAFDVSNFESRLSRGSIPVPEPITLAGIGVPALALVGRRPRRHHARRSTTAGG